MEIAIRYIGNSKGVVLSPRTEPTSSKCSLNNLICTEKNDSNRCRKAQRLIFLDGCSLELQHPILKPSKPQRQHIHHIVLMHSPR